MFHNKRLKVYHSNILKVLDSKISKAMLIKNQLLQNRKARNLKWIHVYVAFLLLIIQNLYQKCSIPY